MWIVRACDTYAENQVTNSRTSVCMFFQNEFQHKNEKTYALIITDSDKKLEDKRTR